MITWQAVQTRADTAAQNKKAAGDREKMFSPDADQSLAGFCFVRQFVICVVVYFTSFPA